jgi:hypothetical protein
VVQKVNPFSPRVLQCNSGRTTAFQCDWKSTTCLSCGHESLRGSPSVVRLLRLKHDHRLAKQHQRECRKDVVDETPSHLRSLFCNNSQTRQMGAVDSRVLFRVVGNLPRQSATVVIHTRCSERPTKVRSVSIYDNSPQLRILLADSMCRRLLHECSSPMEDQKCDAVRVSTLR